MNTIQRSMLVTLYYGICLGTSCGLGIASNFSEKFMNYALVLSLMGITPIFIDMILDFKAKRRITNNAKRNI